MSQLGTAVVLTAFLASCWPMSEPDAWEHSLASCDLRETADRPEWRARCVQYNMNSEISPTIFKRMQTDCMTDGGVLVRGMWCPTEPPAAVCEILHDPYGVPGGGIIKEYEYEPYPEFEQECVEAGNWYWCWI